MENRILGFYKKEWKTKNLIPLYDAPDGTEYVHYMENGREYLTSGVHRWSGDKINRYISVMKKVDRIDLDCMVKRMQEFYPYSWVLKALMNY